MSEYISCYCQPSKSFIIEIALNTEERNDNLGVHGTSANILTPPMIVSYMTVFLVAMTPEKDCQVKLCSLLKKEKLPEKQRLP